VKIKYESEDLNEKFYTIRILTLTNSHLSVRHLVYEKIDMVSLLDY